MRILTVPPNQYAHHSDELAQMHRLRAMVFRGRLEWDVTVTESGEFDEYDRFDPTYILAITDDARVVGCARLLPTQGPTMLEGTFSQLLVRGELYASPTMVESSRFCVDTSLAEPRGGGRLHLATLTMFAGIIEWSMANGYNEIVTATDLRFERILNRAGWPMKRLGEPTEIGNTVAIAGSLPADPESLGRVRPMGYQSAISDIQPPKIRSAA
ncbi:acyl homoserine lactone synthase [Rhizobium sp. NFR07]|uniref:acyl-homoserine-lactone synthase n=1 Tax=Rhizobium sp. NFR07 TaxID=1566262 RepID=UPI0008E2D63B|nr:acyl-homoserine-lactone synthase TraI [Rhizobium sp. NFR07]SFB57356.1 acyl homoserine lactone synthase [Rhizobium sp. NFR07]